MKSVSYSLGAIAIALFASTLWGGQLSTDALPLTDGPLSALLGGPELPLSFQLGLGLILLLVLTVANLTAPVVQTPNLKVSLGLGTFVALIVVSIGVSDFRFTSIAAALQWIFFATVFFGVVARAGRTHGPRIVLGAIAAGATILALKAIGEYGQMRTIDPTWRPFAGWIQQNALAGMLILGFFSCAAVSLLSERLGRMLAMLGCGLIGFALFLSQSKGGLLSWAVGLFVFGAFALTWKLGRRVLPLVAGLGLAVLLVGGLKLAPSPAGQSAGVLDRVTQSSSTRAQSEGFRKLLWQSAVEIVKQTPTGTGINTFQFVGSRAGLTPPTYFAHSTYLQLASDASPLALLAFLVTIGLWLREMVRGAKALTADQNLVRAAILGAIAASLVHNQLDNLLYHFGIGMAFFALLAVGLQVAADGSGPEYVPLRYRGVPTVLIAVIVLIATVQVIWAEWGKAQTVTLAATDRASALSTIDGVIARAPQDGDAYSLRSRLANTAEAAKADAERAAELAPKLRHFRFLAQIDENLGLRPSAATEYRRALRLDPNNLPSWLGLMRIAVADGNDAEVANLLKKLAEIENSSYSKVRAIPELIPTEIAEARVLAVDSITSREERKRLLILAADTLLAYFETTAPRVIQAVKSTELGFAGETRADLERKAALAQDVVSRLQAMSLTGPELERVLRLPKAIVRP